MNQKQIEPIEIQPVGGCVDFVIRPPGSKSITNRALLCAALAGGDSSLRGALKSDDTRVMIDCLQKLGVEVSESSDGSELKVAGCSGRFTHQEASLYVENSGTTIRFLTAALGIHGGNFRLHGVERMHERPIGPLTNALNQLGGTVVAESENACPPVVISNPQLVGGTASVSGKISSQYLSGLMMAAPLASDGLTIQVTDELVSKPYVKMTRAVMASFGVDSVLDFDSNPISFLVNGGKSYAPIDYRIEPDASAASYFWAVAAICGGKAKVEGLSRHSLQGDVRFVECLEAMGCKIEYQHDSITVSGKAVNGIDVDMSEISDTVQTIAAVALFVDGPTRIRGVAHNRVKETDRIGDLATELRKLGALVEEHEDGLTIAAGPLVPAILETYNDHRMAMSLALVGLRNPKTIITNPGCTAKTYPLFFEDLKKAVSQ